VDRQYKFASVDILLNASDYKRVYIHKHHKFHIGDACDPEFMGRIVAIEKPDVIINAVTPIHESVNYRMRGPIAAAMTIEEVRGHAKVLQVRPLPDLCTEDKERAGWDFVEALAVSGGGLALLLPKCFGIRDRHGQLAEMIRAMLSTEKEEILFSDKTEEWAYAEDVASMIWFLIEKGAKGSFIMPSLGKASPEQMARIVDEVLNLNIYPLKRKCVKEDLYIEGISFKEWHPDSSDMKQSLIKTIKWFYMNKWALER